MAKETTFSDLVAKIQQGNLPMEGSRAERLGADPLGTAAIIAALGPAAATSAILSDVEAALDNVPGYTYGVKFGRNSDVDTTSTPEDIIGHGGLYTGFPTTADETVELVSTDAVADASGGTGMQTAYIYGLKTSTSTTYERSELLTVGGAASVDTWYRINRIEGIDYGAGATNAGEVTCRRTTDTATIFASVQAGYGQSHIAAYTVPAQKNMVITNKILTIGRPGSADASAVISLRRRVNNGTGFNAIRVYDFTNESPITGNGDLIVLNPLDDIIWRCESVSGNDSSPNATFPYILVDVVT